MSLISSFHLFYKNHIYWSLVIALQDSTDWLTTNYQLFQAPSWTRRRIQESFCLALISICVPKCSLTWRWGILTESLASPGDTEVAGTALVCPAGIFAHRTRIWGELQKDGTVCPPHTFHLIPIGNAWMGAHNPQEHAKQTASQYKHRNSPSDTSRIGRKHFREVLYLSAIQEKPSKMGFFRLPEDNSFPTPLSHNFPLT